MTVFVTVATLQRSFIALTAIALSACGSKEGPTNSDELPIVRGYATVRVDVSMVEPMPERTVIDTVEFSGETLIILDPRCSQNLTLPPQRDRPQTNVTEFSLNDDGRQALSEYTANPEVIQTRLAVRFMDRWAAFPSIQSQILNGQFVLLNLTVAEQDTAEAAFGIP